MKICSLILPGALVAGAALFMGSTDLRAFTLDGNVLNLFNRDFRIFNNFSDPTANDNTVPQVNYPGYTGAVMALWKGAAEWGSQAMGTGTGDITQASIGSGGANFDAYFAGQATSAGVMGDNIMSELIGSSGGTLAFTEVAGVPGVGWRILYYSTWEWCDGPDFINGTGNSFDMQGITCHEYGHALGMGHTTVPGATMFASVAALDITPRSIEPDDIAGVQSVYGVKLATKLTVTGTLGSGSPLRILGTHFSSNNEVWFTPNAPTAATALLPVKVSGINSPSTTSLDVNVPAAAGIGVIMVRDGLSSAHAALSNPLPYNPAICPKPNPYCVGKLNSIGQVPSVSTAGSNSLTIGGLQLVLNGGVPNKPGLFLYSDLGAASIPFQGGTLCVAPPIVRSPPFQIDVFGFASWPINFTAFDVGSYRYFQTWYRDPQSPDGIGVGLSNAIEVKFCP